MMYIKLVPYLDWAEVSHTQASRMQVAAAESDTNAATTVEQLQLRRDESQ